MLGAQVCGLNERSTKIYDKLKISYDSLDPKVKEIFLDMACFYLGQDVDNAMRIWGILGIRNLQGKCLLEVGGENRIQMHDHIRDMGRQIADEGSMPRRLRLCYPMPLNDDLFQQWSPVSTSIIQKYVLGV